MSASTGSAGAVPLSHLVARLGEVRILGDIAAVTVGDVAYDSRSVVPGSIFACIRGARRDGHRYAAEAVAAGAVALVCSEPLDLGVPELLVPDPRSAMAPLAAGLYGDPAESLEVVAVTGTNGKTTVAAMVAAICEAAGRPSAAIGTLTGGLTTPESPDLQRRLAELRDAAVRCVALEASSHALELHRLDALVADVAVFTNLGRDHLDFHGSMEAYFRAKARLFDPDHSRRAVVNLDDPHGRLLADAARVPTVGYSLGEVSGLSVRIDGSSFSWRGQAIELSIGGGCNVVNALAAASAAVLLGIEPAAVSRGLRRLRPIPGRFEVLDLPAPFEVVVDFAHTPDALSRLLRDAREVAGSGRVNLVFGCGGDRDRSKRPLMGAVASEGADRVVITSDNPRGEDPAAIVEEIRSGTTSQAEVIVEPDRRTAIARALADAAAGDIVVVAGKGHEVTQIVGEDVRPFDDRLVVREELERLEAVSG